MGEVYRATDSVLERKVAVKLLSERHAREPEVRARFRREALAAARLSGTPHVITVFDVGEHGEQPYIVMEYLDGGSVHDRLKEGRVPPEQALEWLSQAGQALDRAHVEGIVHRDVKPANLLLDRDGKVVVTDFGIASTTGVDTLTLPGTVLGTAGYLSPEQARGETATAASDRYGLGIVAFELLTGRRPFESETAATEALAHVTAPVPSAEGMHPELPEGVDEILERALAKEPDARPATCAELVSDLRRAFAAREATPAVVPPPTRSAAAPVPDTGAPTRQLHRARRRSSRKFILVAAGLVVAGLLTAVLLGAIRDGDSRAERNPPTTTQPTQTQPTETQPTETQPTETQPTTTTTTEEAPDVDGAALNDEGFALMEQGRYEQALPLLEQAVADLQGSAELVEAWASYNLAFTRFALGRCEGVLELLDRSEAVQGERRDIDRLQKEAHDRCVEGGDGDDD
jgi:eukaryotic-like serine/threonine-protein kinase